MVARTGGLVVGWLLLLITWADGRAVSQSFSSLLVYSLCRFLGYSIDQSLRRAVDRSVVKSVGLSIGQSLCWSIDRSLAFSADLAGKGMGKIGCWSFLRFVFWLFGCRLVEVMVALACGGAVGWFSVSWLLSWSLG